MNKYSDFTFRRGVFLSSLNEGDIRRKLNDRNFPQLSSWTKTYFGPNLKLWYDPRLKLARQDTPRFSLAIMGLAINPYDGHANNEEIVQELFNRLNHSIAAFRAYVDELTGSFLILMRDGENVYLQQDAAATKTIYYHADAQGQISAGVHASIIAALHDLKPDPRAEETWAAESYRKDPSRYLPGMTTQFSDLLPLSANTELDFSARKPHRIFPRAPLMHREFGDDMVSEVAQIFRRQADMIAAMGRPMYLAATGGRDSRVSYAAFSRYTELQLFSFHYPSRGHLSKDVQIAAELAKISGHKLSIFDLENRNPAKSEFVNAFFRHSPRGIWPDAAYAYVSNFSDDAIHIRSTVSEIGRIFYVHRWAKDITARNFAPTYTFTKFHEVPWVIESLDWFFKTNGFTKDNLLNFDPYDMFYWEHRNSKWQNILCVEAEMACDVFIPYNNRRLLTTMMSLHYEDRKEAKLHFAVIEALQPRFSSVEIA